MWPQISIHRPQGLLPKVAVGKRTVIDYQPSWLLLAIPTTLLALRAARRKLRGPGNERQSSPDGADVAAGPKRRWRPQRVVAVTVPVVTTPPG